MMLTTGSEQHRVRAIGRGVLCFGILSYTGAVSIGGYWRGTTTVLLMAIALGLCLPWLFAHRYPLRSFAVMSAAGTVQLIEGFGPIPANLMLLAGVYAVAAHAPRRAALLCATAVVAGAVIAAIRWGETFAASAVPLSAIGTTTVAVCLWGTHTALRRVHDETLRTRADQLEREQDHLAQIAAAEERARIARDLHDVISHSLAGILTMSEGTLRSSPELAEEHKNSLRMINTHCRDSLSEFRKLLKLLRDEPADMTRTSPLVSNLEFLVESAASDTVATDLTVQGRHCELPPTVQETVYRIVQESLTNVRKHAGTSVTKVTASVDVTAENVKVEVSDDGDGSAAEVGAAVCTTDGFGLLGMRERVDSLRGTLFAGSPPDGGFVVRATIPLSSDDRSSNNRYVRTRNN
ncbi:sensor histidine kinase [Rhodococcus sp. IEGM1428]|uniref:sensor histidine kinase n=1 Tax=Rhodococcus sp. IEGM1428 TaxID=3392191 RepID=UPI003D0F38C4